MSVPAWSVAFDLMVGALLVVEVSESLLRSSSVAFDLMVGVLLGGKTLGILVVFDCIVGILPVVIAAI